MRDLHGSVRARGGRRYVITYHPAAGMRFHWVDRAMRADFAEIARLLRAPGA